MATTPLPDVPVAQVTHFHDLGFDLMGKQPGNSLMVKMRRFVGHFGVNWHICASLWVLMLPLIDSEAIYNGIKPLYLLWALHFMKVYGTESVNAATKKCDKKTHRKWVWLVVEALAQLEPELVS